MFRCKACQSTTFQLVLHPSYQGNVRVSYNDFQEVLISTPQQEFIADLMFMNQFAVCNQCGAIKSWDYFFDKTEQPMDLPPPKEKKSHPRE